MHDQALLRLLQLASPALPVGAYSYSEGLESVIDAGKMPTVQSLQAWLTQELQIGAMRTEAAILAQSYGAAERQDWSGVVDWNQQLSALREAEELRSQSWQMGRSLLRLFVDLEPDSLHAPLVTTLQSEGCNGAIAFSLVAAQWQLGVRSTVLGYLYSWATNLVGAGIKLIPLGQTAGQRLLLDLQPVIEAATAAALVLPAEQLGSCGWGVTLASMAHETQYSRLFRS
jgi:urease accessory protein